MKRRILDYIKLIRLPNLFFIVLIQCLMARAVAMPVLKNFSLEAEIIPTFWLVILVLATVFIAAGGYVINDYFDVKIDRINHPQKVLITNTIEKSQAMFFYQVLTTVGVLLGVLVSVFSINVFAAEETEKNALTKGYTETFNSQLYRGDVTGDSKLTIEDASEYLRVASKIKEPKANVDYDLTKDGKITTAGWTGSGRLYNNSCK